jgi:EAL domain-containing protein (putative c-di-GMP-specific phosphodiesterase class I)
VKRLAALRHLPIGLLKIDGQLAQSVRTDPKAEAAVRSLAEFARGAGIATAAKCVETIAIAKHLRKLGVELGQGYAFGLPEPFARVLANL